jgi:hypothetical protein
MSIPYPTERGELCVTADGLMARYDDLEYVDQYEDARGRDHAIAVARITLLGESEFILLDLQSLTAAEEWQTIPTESETTMSTCAGAVDADGTIDHDGPTCPVHEAESSAQPVKRTRITAQAWDAVKDRIEIGPDAADVELGEYPSGNVEIKQGSAYLTVSITGDILEDWSC